jgi:hypothetical protein
MLAVCIQTNVKGMLHGERSPMHEARRRSIRRNPRYGMRRGRSPLASTDMWTELAPVGRLSKDAVRRETGKE